MKKPTARFEHKRALTCIPIMKLCIYIFLLNEKFRNDVTAKANEVALNDIFFGWVSEEIKLEVQFLFYFIILLR